MSRSNYGYDDDDTWAFVRWRQAVNRALQGKRGQAMLRELVQALDEMDDKRLHAGSFATSSGQFCALGVLGAKRGTKMDDLMDESDCDPATVGERFGIAMAMAAEIMHMNDEHFSNIDPAERWRHMRAWAAGNMKTPIAGGRDE